MYIHTSYYTDNPTTLFAFMSIIFENTIRVILTNHKFEFTEALLFLILNIYVKYKIRDTVEIYNTASTIFNNFIILFTDTDKFVSRIEVHLICKFERCTYFRICKHSNHCEHRSPPPKKKREPSVTN